ncbi:ERF superfamily protein [compost metagenome]
MENIIQFSETRGAFMAAFFEAKKNIGKITKKRKNDHLKSNYANLADYLDAIDSAIEDAGLMIIQSPGAFNAAGDMPMETRIEHVATGEHMIAVMEIHVDRKNAQGDGSAISYARRFHIGALFGLAAEDDDGHAAKRKAKDYIKEFELITDIKELKDEARKAFMAVRGNETEQNLIHSYVAKREADLTMNGATGFNPAQPRNAGPRTVKAAPETPAPAADDKPTPPENF